MLLYNGFLQRFLLLILHKNHNNIQNNRNCVKQQNFSIKIEKHFVPKNLGERSKIFLSNFTWRKDKNYFFGSKNG